MSKNLNYNLTFSTSSNVSNMGNIFTTGGNVGIGSSAPAFTLDITGSLRATGQVNLTSSTSIQNSTNNYSLTSGALNVSGDAVIGSELYFLNTTASPPTMNGRGTGSRIVLYPSQTVGGGDYGIGIESNNTWFQVPITSGGYKFYHGTTANVMGSGWVTLTAPHNSRGSIAVANVAGNWITNADAGDFTIRADSTTQKLHLGIGPQNASITLVSSGNIGIGTITPTYNLDITGNSRHYNANGISITISPNNGAFGAIECFTAGNTAKLPLCLNPYGGNVGIGTTAPLARLDISGGGDAGGASGESMLSLQYRTNNGGGFRHFVISRHNAVGLADTGNAIDFYLNNASTASTSSAPGTGNILGMTIAANGVGIKTTSTNSTLTVNNIVADRNVFDHSVSPLTVTQNSSSGTSILNDQLPVMHLCRQGFSGQTFGQRATFALSRYENNAANSRTRLDIQLAQNMYDTQNVMSIRGDGNVGINTTAPGTTLDVSGSARFISNINGPPNFFGIQNVNGGSSAYTAMFLGNETANYLSIFLNSTTRSLDGGLSSATIRNDGGALRLQSIAGNSTIFLGTNGNIGINTLTPSTAKLVISGVPGAVGLDLSSTDQYTEMRVVRNSLSSIDKDMYIQLAAGTGSKLRLYSNNTETMVLSSSNIGIGTATPTSRLTITPSTTESKITLWGNATNHYGFGVSGNQLNYHTETTSADHVFYGGGTNGNGTEVMRVKGTGVVSVTGVVKSSIPSWNVYLTGAGGVTGLITYNATLATAVNCTFNAGTGRVTCTIAGRYYIFFNAFANNDTSTGTQVLLRKNGTSISRCYNNSKLANAYGPSMPISAIVDLVVNDYIDVFCDSGSLHTNDNCYFGGYMLG